MKIEVGKYYKRRDGLKAGPAIENYKIGAATYPFLLGVAYGEGTETTSGHWLSYTEDGKFDASGTEHRGDLIEEWQDPVSKPADVTNRLFYADDMKQKMGLEKLLEDRGIDVDLSEPECNVSDHPYRPLQVILDEAYHQAAHGKGRERHANDRDFIDQPIMEIGRMCGPGFNTGQAMKKIQEAMGMLSRGQDDAAIRELLGAINYTAAAVILIRERPPLVTVTS